MKQEIAPSAKQRVLKKLKITALILVAVIVLLVLADLVYSLVSIHRWTHPEKVTWSSSPAEYGLDYNAFELETENGTVYGWKIPAQQPIGDDAEEWVEVTEYSDKTVVFAGNYDGNRELLDLGGISYMVDLCAAGYNVITFDWTGSGFSDGTKNVFTLEKAEELKAVVQFAADETKASFLAVQGVGFGCYPAAVAAAECEEVDALILDSCYNLFSSVFYDNFGNWSGVDLAPVRETVRLLFPMVSGVDAESYSLSQPIRAMSGKNVLFIQGEQDEIFGSAHVQELYSYAKADNAASVWMVSGVTHLRTRSYDSEGYLNKVSAFLTEAYEEDRVV